MLISSSTPNSNFASTSVLNQFLCPSSLSDNFSNVIGFGIFNGVVCQVDLFELFQRFVVIRGNKTRILKVVRFSHFHTIFNQRNPFSLKIVSFSNLPSVNSFSCIIVNGLRTGRPQVRVVHAKMAHLGGQLVESV